MLTNFNRKFEDTQNRGQICSEIVKNDQKEYHVEAETELKNFAFEDEYFLSNVIRGDKNWIYGYDLEIEKQSFQSGKN